MTDNKTALRKQAEEKAFHLAPIEGLKPEGLDTLSPAATRQALQELRVHQIELEMQNEELRQSQAELDAARARYFDLYDLAPVGYVTLGEKGLILEANFTAATLLGATRGDLVQQPLSRFILKEDRDIFYRLRKQLLDMRSATSPRLHSGQAGQADANQEYELRLLKKDGTTFWAHLEAAVQDPATGEAQAGEPELRIVLSDITKRKQAEEALQTSERTISATLDALSSHIAILDDNGTILAVNRAWRDFARANSAGTANFGEGANYLNVCNEAHGPHSEEAAAFTAGFRSVIRGEHDELSFEYPCHSPDEERWFNVRITRFPGKNIHWLVTAHENITKRKETEAKLLEAVELLQKRAAELEMFNKVMIDRELRIIEIKEEVNALCREQAREPRYPPIWREGAGS